MKNTPIAQKAKNTQQPSKKVGKNQIINESELSKYLGEVYKDIIGIKVEKKDTIQTLLNRFYEVMTKHGICQGNWSENGRTISTAEWNICWHTFKGHIQTKLMWVGLMSQPPKHLLAYGQKPSEKKQTKSQPVKAKKA